MSENSSSGGNTPCNFAAEDPFPPSVETNSNSNSNSNQGPTPALNAIPSNVAQSPSNNVPERSEVNLNVADNPNENSGSTSRLTRAVSMEMDEELDESREGWRGTATTEHYVPSNESTPVMYSNLVEEFDENPRRLTIRLRIVSSSNDGFTSTTSQPNVPLEPVNEEGEESTGQSRYCGHVSGVPRVSSADARWLRGERTQNIQLRGVVRENRLFRLGTESSSNLTSAARENGPNQRDSSPQLTSIFAPGLRRAPTSSHLGLNIQPNTAVLSDSNLPVSSSSSSIFDEILEQMEDEIAESINEPEEQPSPLPGNSLAPRRGQMCLHSQSGTEPAANSNTSPEAPTTSRPGSRATSNRNPTSNLLRLFPEIADMAHQLRLRNERVMRMARESIHLPGAVPETMSPRVIRPIVETGNGLPTAPPLPSGPLLSNETELNTETTRPSLIAMRAFLTNNRAGGDVATETNGNGNGNGNGNVGQVSSARRFFNSHMRIVRRHLNILRRDLLRARRYFQSGNVNPHVFSSLLDSIMAESQNTIQPAIQINNVFNNGNSP